MTVVHETGTIQRSKAKGIYILKFDKNVISNIHWGFKYL